MRQGLQDTSKLKDVTLIIITYGLFLSTYLRDLPAFWSHFQLEKQRNRKAESGFHSWELEHNIVFLIFSSLSTDHIPLASHQSIWTHVNLFHLGKGIHGRIWSKFVAWRRVSAENLSIKDLQFLPEREEKILHKVLFFYFCVLARCFFVY